MSVSLRGVLAILVLLLYFVMPKSLVFDYVGIHKDIGDELTPWKIQRYLILALLSFYVFLLAFKERMDFRRGGIFFL